MIHEVLKVKKKIDTQKVSVWGGGGPQCFNVGDKIRSGLEVGGLATSPLPSGGGSQCFNAGDEIRNGPQMGGLATSPLPSRGSPTLHNGGQNQKGPTDGRFGYITPAIGRIPNTSQWGDEIRSGPQVGEWATSPLPSRGSPTLHSGGQNQKWPTSGWIGYFALVAWGVPNSSMRGTKSQVAHK